MFARRLSIGVAAILICSLPVAAQQSRIGEVASIRNEAARSGKPLGVGDSVFPSEAITTGADSLARIAFVDQTHLAIGASSRVVLDRFVFSGDASSQEMTVNLARGAFRFSTGNLEKRAYRINTPTATMGVRGTIVDLDIGSETRFFGIEGQAEICALRTRECAVLNPGETITVGPRGTVNKTNQPNMKSAINDQCAKSPSLCNFPTQAAALGPATALPAAFGLATAIAAITQHNKNKDDLPPPVSP